MFSPKFFDELFLLKLTMMQSDHFNCAPLKIITAKTNQNHENIQFTTNTEAKLQKLKFGSILLSVMTCFQYIQCIMVAKRDTTNHPGLINILGWFTCLCMTTQSSYIFFYRRKVQELQYYQNNLITLRNNQKKTLDRNNESSWNNFSVMERVLLLCIPMILVTAAVMGPIYGLIFHSYNPCKPSLIGFILLEECLFSKVVTDSFSLVNIWNKILKIFLLVGNLWAWLFGTYGFAFAFTTIHIFPTVIIRRFIQNIRNRLANSSHVYLDSLMYRQLQIFNTLTNDVQKNCLGVFICGTVIGLSISLNLLVEVSSGAESKTDISIVTIIVTSTINSIACILIMLGGLVSVYTDSEQIIPFAKKMLWKYEQRATRKWARMYWRSCNQFKIKFGDTNYLEELTQIKCIDLSFDLTIQFLLLSRNK